jgi:hypothetical protein
MFIWSTILLLQAQLVLLLVVLVHIAPVALDMSQ